jgi:hypothetical protein
MHSNYQKKVEISIAICSKCICCVPSNVQNANKHDIKCHHQFHVRDKATEVQSHKYRKSWIEFMRPGSTYS